MKSAIQRLVKQNDTVWRVIELTLGKLNGLYQKLKFAREWEPSEYSAVDLRRIKAWERLTAPDPAFDQKCERLFGSLTVRNGCFQGMRYPSMKAVGSACLPKLLGSYEAELSGVIERIVQQPYSAIVDVGCAEGYYAVGLGMRLPNAQVHAFDISEEAIKLCRQMAELNGVNLITGNFCDRETLLNLDLGPRALIILDCEGYEAELINGEVASRMRQHDFLIETHDFLDLAITPELLAHFEQTHDCEVIASIDDITKAYEYNYPELADFDLYERCRVLQENRCNIMRWIFAKAR